MLIDVSFTCALLSQHNNILILAHQKPDGDTLGASFALLYALLKQGKRARVKCADGFPERYSFMYKDYEPDKSFDPSFIVTVDVASTELLGTLGDKYKDKIDLCIDHHKSNTLYAKHTLLDASAPAACQIIYDVLRGLGADFDKDIANAIFTGLSTDTGCFKYANVTAKCHAAAADMIDFGAQHAKINKLIFDTKSRGMLMVDRLMIEITQFYLDGLCALAVLPVDVNEKYGVCEADLDGISGFPVRIEGVFAGVTVRSKPDDTYRVSLRTVSPVDASLICEGFGGGGHANAAGCTIKGGFQETIDRIIASVKDELTRHGIS